MSDVFISYAREDIQFAQKLNGDLQRSGLNTWIDEYGIQGGEDWPERIAKAIQSAAAMIVILSPASLPSPWVRREMTYADDTHIRIVPLIYRQCSLPEWYKLRFGSLQWIDFSSETYETNLTKLLTSMERILGSPTKTTPPNACRFCSAIIDPNDQFCSSCGKSLRGETTPRVEPRSQFVADIEKAIRSGTVKIRRQNPPGYNYGTAGKFGVWLDGEKVETLPHGEERNITVAEGPHRLFVEWMRFKSKTIEFIIKANQTVDLVCGQEEGILLNKFFLRHK